MTVTVNRDAIVGVLATGSVGLALVVAAIALGAGTSALVGMLIFGGFLMLPALIFLVVARHLLRGRRLIFDAAGLRWQDPHPRGTSSFALTWSELAGVAIHEPAVGERVQRNVCLDLFPADPEPTGFATRHPELSPLWELYGATGAYRLPLTYHRPVVVRIRAAMDRFAPHLCRGGHVHEEQ